MALRLPQHAQVHDLSHRGTSHDALKRDVAKPWSPLMSPPMSPMPQQHTKRMIATVGQMALGVAIAVVALSIAVLATNPLSAHNDSSSSSNETDAIAAFLTWFDAAGGERNPHIDIATFVGMGKGVLATHDIHEHDQLLFVPINIIICRETIAHAAPAHLQSPFQQLADAQDELLTAFVLLEMLRSADESPSAWHAYWQLLPRIDRRVAPLVFASSRELAALQDAHITAAAKHEQQLTARAFQRFCRLFATALPPSLARGDLERQYRWTRFLVNSRAFSVQGERLLVPFGDVFNGAPHAAVRPAARGQQFLLYHHVDDRGVAVRADRAVAAGAQVYEDYGDNSNYVYALHHGFLMAHNPFDCTFVQLPLLEALGGTRDDSSDDGDVVDLKRRVLAHFRVSNSPSVCVLNDGSVSLEHQELARFYFIVASTSATEMRSACGQRQHYQQCFLSTAAALAVDALDVDRRNDDDSAGDNSSFAGFLSRAVQSHLASFATTRAEDEQLLLATSLTSGMRAAITFRSSRKLILQSALAALQQPQQQTLDIRNENDAIRSLHATEEAKTQPDATASSVEDAATRIDRFQRWIEQQALPVNHLTLAFVSDAMGYGTFATKPLARGEPYVSIPTSIVMDLTSAANSGTLRRLVRSLGRRAVDDDAVLLVLHLLDEAFGPASRTSRWRAYIDVLPTVELVAKASPLFYTTDHHLALLQATDLHAAVRSYQTRVRLAYATLQQHIAAALSPTAAFAWLTESRFLWATAILDSRSIWWSGKRHLVPLLDMVNCMDLGAGHAAHHTDLEDVALAAVDVLRKSQSTPIAVTRASWDFALGEQVVENYAQPNHIYLLYHGFVLAQNQHDCAHVALATNDRAAISALPQPRRRRLMEMLEALALKTWTPELCVDPTNAASVTRFAKVALLAETPLRALELAGAAAPPTAPLTLAEIHAGIAVARRRLAALATGLQHKQADNNAAESDHRVAVIRLYLRQQHALWTALHSTLGEFEGAADPAA